MAPEQPVSEQERQQLSSDGYTVLEEAANFSTTVQRLLGYGVVDGTFFGHVDGRDPIKLIPTRDRGEARGPTEPDTAGRPS